MKAYSCLLVSFLLVSTACSGPKNINETDEFTNKQEALTYLKKIELDSFPEGKTACIFEKDDVRLMMPADESPYLDYEELDIVHTEKIEDGRTTIIVGEIYDMMDFSDAGSSFLSVWWHINPIGWMGATGFMLRRGTCKVVVDNRREVDRFEEAFARMKRYGD